MKVCALIPCYNHNDTISELLAQISIPVIIVDDGSDIPVKAEGAEIFRLQKNSGKAKALQLGFQEALNRGFTHVITLDADLQHDPVLIPSFLKEIENNPDALIAGIRDFSLPEIPESRRFMNRFSNFWFKFETGTELADTQCGYRAYPLELVKKLNISFGRYAYEAEILVKTIWSGAKIVSIKIPTIYTEKSTQNSHYRPFKDTVLISLMNTKLSFLSLFPKSFLKFISVKK